MNPVEAELIKAGHPRFTTPAGDQREHCVPCDTCRRWTAALRPTRCLRCLPISQACPLCNGLGCEYGCGHCVEFPGIAGPDAHRMCTRCQGRGTVSESPEGIEDW